MSEWQGYYIGLEKQSYMLRNAKEADLYEKEFIWTGTVSIFLIVNVLFVKKV